VIAYSSSLQRGRSLSTAEFRALPRHRSRQSAASTGPQSFDCGIDCRASLRFPRPRRFNGAAVFRLRNYSGDGHRDRLRQRNVASTGPQSFDCGIPRVNPSGKSALAGFNGAAVFRLRNLASHHGTGPVLRRLQRGRSLSTAEFQHSAAPPKQSHGFNGAAVFRLRNSRLIPAWNAERPASTGPQSFDCGIAFRRFRLLRPQGRFNGAAVFRLRNFRPNSNLRARESPRFNGAAVFRLRNFPS